MHCVHPSQGFGVTARSTVDTRKLDPTAIIVFHQAYVSSVLSFFIVSSTRPAVMLANTCAMRLVSYSG